MDSFRNPAEIMHISNSVFTHSFTRETTQVFSVWARFYCEDQTREEEKKKERKQKCCCKQSHCLYNCRDIFITKDPDGNRCLPVNNKSMVTLFILTVILKIIVAPGDVLKGNPSSQYQIL